MNVKLAERLCKKSTIFLFLYFLRYFCWPIIKITFKLMRAKGWSRKNLFIRIKWHAQKIPDKEIQEIFYKFINDLEKMLN